MVFLLLPGKAGSVAEGEPSVIEPKIVEDRSIQSVESGSLGSLDEKKSGLSVQE